MIRYAGLGAMGNAVPEVKAAADAVTGSNAEDGLVQALEPFYFALLRCTLQRVAR